MQQKKLITVYQNRLESIGRNFELAHEQNNRDGVHDLRVDLKRMRAFFDLIESINSHFHSKAQFKPFRAIARNTGVLRDAQVQQEVLGAVNTELGIDLGEYESYLNEREMEGLASFRHFVDTDDPLSTLKSAESAILYALKDVSRTAAETKAHGRFYNLRNELIILSSEPILRPEILHDIRKLAKTSHYTIEIISDGLSILKGIDAFVDAIRQMHQALGKWHDDDVSIGHLQDFLYSHGIDPSVEPYVTLAGFLRNRRDSSFGEITPAFAIFNDAALEI